MRGEEEKGVSERGWLSSVQVIRVRSGDDFASIVKATRDFKR